MPLFNPKYKQYEQNAPATTPKTKPKSNLQQSNPGNPIKADPRWTGFTSYAPHTHLAQLVLLFVNLALSGVLIKRERKVRDINIAIKDEASNVEFNIPKDNEIVFYEFTTPIVSIFYTIIAIFLHRIRKSPPLVSLLFSTGFLIAWGIQLAIWVNCDTRFVRDGKFAVCSAWPMLDTEENGPVVWSRIAFGVLCALGYFVLMIFAVVAMQHKGLLTGPKKDAEELSMLGKASVDSAESVKKNDAPVLPIVPIQAEARAA